MSLPVLREHTDAVIARLDALLDVPVGDAEAPVGVPPHVVVYPIAGGASSGPLAAPHDDANLIYQVTCTGTSRKQAQWLEDKVMGLLNGFTVAGRTVCFVDLENYGGGVRNDAGTSTLFISTPRFRVISTPA